MTRRFAVVLALLVLAPNLLFAQAATLRSEEAWRNLIRQHTVRGFDAVEGPVTDQIAGLSFSGLDTGIPIADDPPFGISPLSGHNVLHAESADGSSTGGFSVSFHTPVAGAGIWFAQASECSLLIHALDADGDVIGSFENADEYSSEWKFVGFVAQSPAITRLEVRLSGSNWAVFENLHFGSSGSGGLIEAQFTGGSIAVEGQSNPPDGSPSDTLGNSSVLAYASSGGGGTSGGLIGASVAHAGWIQRGFTRTTVRLTATATASQPHGYGGDANISMTCDSPLELTITEPLYFAAENPIGQIGFFRALTGEVQGDILRPGRYQVSFSIGVFLDTDDTFDRSELDWQLVLSRTPIPPPPPPSPFRERWNGVVLGSYDPGAAIDGDDGQWLFSDSGGPGPGQSSADVIRYNGTRALRVTAVPGHAGRLDRFDLAARVTPESILSFSAWGDLANPTPAPSDCANAPCGDLVWVQLTDNRDNRLVYVLQRAPAATARAEPGYREIFLDPGDRFYARRLFDDFDLVAGFVPESAVITSISFGVQGNGHAILDNIAITTDSVLGTAMGASPHAAGDADGNITLSFVSSSGRPVVLRRSSSQAWTAAALSESAAGVPDSVNSRATLSWIDPSDGRSYVSVASPEGLLIVDTTAEPMTVRNVTDDAIPGEPAATPITGPSTVFRSNEGHINIVGIDPVGDVVRYYQTGATHAGQAEWAFMNLSATQLEPNGIDTPDFASNLVSYVASWGALHVAGLDSSGDIHAVWWAPTLTHWRADNLSRELDTEPLLVEAGLTAYVTPWGGLNLAGLNNQGDVVVRWWAPGLLAWQNTNLTDNPNTQAPGTPTGFDLIGLTSFVTPWGTLHICGVTPEGDLVNYWWAPQFGGAWRVTSISDAAAAQHPDPPRIVGALAGLGGPDGVISIFGAADNGDVVRYHWQSTGGNWQAENASETADRR